MACLWFVHGTGKMMIEILEMMKAEVENKNYKVNGGGLRVNLEVSP